MSDEDYANFLSKANKSYSTPSAKTSSQSQGISTKAHHAIRALGDRVYSTDADEPFTDTTFEWEDNELPSNFQFGELVTESPSDIVKLTTQEWDPNGAYSDVVDAVKQAAGGSSEAAVYRVEGDGARATYYILAHDKSKKELVGVKVLAVES